MFCSCFQEVIGACHKRSESFEKRGPHLSFEYGAYESRLLAEMLWKGSVVILEVRGQSWNLGQTENKIFCNALLISWTNVEYFYFLVGIFWWSGIYESFVESKLLLTCTWCYSISMMKCTPVYVQYFGQEKLHKLYIIKLYSISSL